MRRVRPSPTAAGIREEKYWTVSATTGALEHLLALFADRPVEVDPALRPANLRGDQSVQADAWIIRFIGFHGRRDPGEMGELEINQFLTSLAVREHVAASTQNQALAALLFLYDKVLNRQLGEIGGVVRARRPRRLPVVLTRPEVRAVLAGLDRTPRLVCMLLYGSGMRLLECLRLRVKDIDVQRNEIAVRDGKGGKDRVTMLPGAAREPLLAHLEKVRRQHTRDLARGLGRVPLPDALARKYPDADRQWAWQWVFPASSHYVDRRMGVRHKHSSA